MPMIWALCLLIPILALVIMLRFIWASPRRVPRRPDYARIQAIEHDLGLAPSNYRALGIEPADTSSSIIRDNEKFLDKTERALMEPLKRRFLETQEQIAGMFGVPPHIMGPARQIQPMDELYPVEIIPGKRIFNCSHCKSGNVVGTVVPNRTLCQYCKLPLLSRYAPGMFPLR